MTLFLDARRTNAVKFFRIYWWHPWLVIHRNGDDRNLAADARAVKF
jgi:hypothetical protein